VNSSDNQRVKLSKRLLRESLIRLLEQHHIYEITVSQLCTAAQINRSTFYKYYNNVREIYEEIKNEALSACAACVATVDSQDYETIIKRTEELLAHIKENADIFRLLLENSKDGEFSYKLVENTVGAVTKMYTPVLGSKKKYAQYLSLFVVSGALSVMKKWLDTGMKESPRELAKLILYIADERFRNTDPVP
jgi:AcrR family transcriptional regulator